MLKKITLTYFVFHFLLGAILPNNDFSFFVEIPKIYTDFQKINGKTDFSEFLEEQFFDVEKWLNLDEDFEKEQIPVKFHYNFSSFILFAISFPPQFSFSLSTFFLSVKPLMKPTDRLIDNFLSNIFHPPQLMLSRSAL